MAKFQIICDAGSAIESEFLNNENITVIPVYLIADGKRYILDAKRTDLAEDKMYEIIKNKKDFYYQSSLYLDIKNVYERYLRAGLDLLVVKSSNSTYFSSDSSNLIKNELLRLYPERKIIFLDSLCLSLGVNYILKIAINCNEQEQDVSQTIQNIDEILSSVNQYVVLPGKKKIKTNALGFYENHHHRHNFLFKGNNGYLEYQYSFFTAKPALRRIVSDIRKNISSAGEVTISYGDCKLKYIKFIERSLKKHNIQIKKEPVSLTLMSILGSSAIGIVYRKKI